MRICCLILAVTAVLAISAGRAEVLDSAANGFTVRHSVVIAAERAGVYGASVDRVSEWWDADHSITGVADNLYIKAIPGGCFCERLGGHGGLIHMTVSFVNPGVMLRFTGGLGPLGLMGVNGNMTWEYEAHEEGTLVTWNYAVGGYMNGGLDTIAPGVDGVLGAALGRLQRLLETGECRQHALMTTMEDFVATPRPAATVAIVRAAEPAPEILLLRRHSKAVFASHYVFPGGVLDTCDRELHELSEGWTAQQGNVLLGIENGLDYFSAAIREAFEESGVLFARDPAGRWAFSGDDTGQLEIDACRAGLNDGSLSWAEFLQRYAFRPAYDALTYIAFWVTPRVQAKRFSTRFFLGVLPEGQHASHDDGELTHSRWMTAADALAACERGEIKLMGPTFSTLREIAACGDVGEVVSWARSRADTGMATLLPAFVTVNGKEKVVLPGDPHYPEDIDT